MHTFRPYQLRKNAAPVFYSADEPYYEAAEPVPYYGADAPSALQAAGGVAAIGLLLGLILLPTFVIAPWLIKQVKPEWSYGKRLATTVIIGFGLTTITTITTIVRAAAGTSTTATK